VELSIKFSTGDENHHEVILLPLSPDSTETLPALLVGVVALDAVEWQAAAILPQPEASPTFRFVDIGAGIPAASMPPDDFNAAG
jgi:hypothetical protein